MSDLFAVDVSVDFIGAVVSHVEKRLKTERHITVLFPNRRAVRFFEHRLASPLQMRVTAASLEDFAKESVYSLSDSPPLFQLDIDRYFILHDILASHAHLYTRLGGNLDQVFPWCVHLSNLFDEFDRHLISQVQPQQYLADVVEEARDILRNLDTLFRDYRRIMEENNLTYSGDLYRRLDAMKENLKGPFVLAGFSLLTRAQESIFRHIFRDNETSVFFHTDLHNRHPVTNPYRLYDTWMNGTFWGEKPILIRGQDSFTPEITFYESFDTHAETRQLTETLAETLEKAGLPGSPLAMGVVMPDSKILFPVLYALEFPGMDVSKNITIGFPFEGSVFYRLLDSLMALTLTRHPKRGFHHVPLRRFLTNPLVSLLNIDGIPFEKTAERLQADIIARNLSFITPESLKASDTLSETDVRLSQWLFDEILFPFALSRTLREAGTVLTKFVRAFGDILSQNSEDELERQLLRNFLDTVLINLNQSATSKRDLASPQVLCRILKHLVTPLHIPFEGNPLKGLQVMGMLESRLLNFTHLFILDVNEGILPENVKIDPLLPPSLNPIVGLPSVKTREALFRYTFFRLVDGSKNAHIFYQKGVSGDDKRIRSRFVEQLLLEEEIRHVSERTERTTEKKASVREVEAALVQTATFQIPPPTKPAPERPTFYEAKLEECLRGVISPSFLDEYLTCPHRFYLHRILQMPEEENVQESQAAPEVGQMVHHILQKSFIRVIGAKLDMKALDMVKKAALKMVPELIRDRFPALSPLRTRLLENLTEFRLKTFFAFTEKETSQFSRFHVMAVEKDLACRLKGYKLYGRADRIDKILKNQGESAMWRILDYKTGISAKVPSRKLSEFLSTFDFRDTSLEALSNLKVNLRSIQLPMYLYLFRKEGALKTGETVEADLFLLGSPPGERPLKGFTEDILSLDQIASLILYLLNHMRQNPYITPFETTPCPTCPYVKICRYTPRAEAT